MLRIARIFIILSIFALLLVGSASADSGVKTGTILGWPESSYLFHFDDYVSVDSDIVASWSIMNVVYGRGWFYGHSASTEAAHVQGITDICDVTDASIYPYDNWVVGPVSVGEFVLFHNTDTGYYAAFRVDAIYGPSNLEALADVTWYLQENGSANFGPCETICQIDIKPSSDPNSINLGSKGVVPVAVLTTDEFNASTVDPVTVLFAGASPLRWTMEDVDLDGDMDILFHFKTRELNLDDSSNEAMLKGITFDGTSIIGQDAVQIVP